MSMLVLGIESSCDETAIALIERGRKNRVVSEGIKSQIPIHQKFGGIVPELASRNHYEIIDRLCRKVLKEAGVKIEDISLFSVTQGPGLMGSLLIGLSFAKALSYTYQVPLVPVDHIQAHVEAAFIENPGIGYPVLALVVSGGHTSLLYYRKKFDFQLLARTRDDAAGEAMDKAAKFFSLGYPGGPVLEQLYPRGNPARFKFTIPRMSDGSGDFSFSGYKTALINYAGKYQITRGSQDLLDLLSSFLNSVTDYLLKKTLDAAGEFPVKSVIAAGGVSRNALLREKLLSAFSNSGQKVYLPSLNYCTDNASMTAWLGYEKYLAFPDQDYFDWQLNCYSRAQYKKGAKHR